MRLELHWDGRQVVAAKVISKRPPAARMLVGQTAVSAVALVPRLFSLCGRAQGVAARLAWEAARSELGDTASRAGDLRDVLLEVIGEHLWRLLLDWPAVLGLATRKAEFIAWRKRLLTVADQASAEAFGDELRRWLNDEPPLVVPPFCTSAPAVLLPMLTAAEWASQSIDENFAMRPSYSGLVAETGPLARLAHTSEVAILLAEGKLLAARVLARCAELRLLATALDQPQLITGWLDAATLAPGVGLARVETARGLLLHLMQVNDGKVARYAIVAPTEWNFHPQGAFVREIVACPAVDRAEAGMQAQRLALALDPCVTYEVVIKDA